MERLAAQRRHIAALLEQLAQAGRRPMLIETHISWVVLLEDLTYKFKKALRLEFLDYLLPAARRRCCEEEVRLNGRYAAALYLGVSRLAGPASAPRIDGAGRTLDYAVRMRTFPQDALWTSRLAAGQLGTQEASQLAVVLARFHDAAAICPSGAPWGAPSAIGARTAADLRETRAVLPADQAAPMLDMIEAWHTAVSRRLARVFALRRTHGAVRECHGDLHCANILTMNGHVQPFDGIEFNAGLRWTDRMQDLAFAWMDLQFHERADLAARLLSDYLAASGDYEGLAVLPYYRVQRALVRAKVAALGRDTALALRYLVFAARAIHAPRGAVVLLHGLSGSGKSTVASALVEPLGAIQVRSDVERKRLFGPGEDGLYSAQCTAATYRRLAQVARHAAGAGIAVIVDAASLQGWQRRMFADIASARHVPFLIVQVTAPAEVLLARLRWRAAHGADPSDADAEVLQSQRSSMQPLAPDELSAAVTIPSGTCPDQRVRDALAARGCILPA